MVRIKFTSRQIVKLLKPRLGFGTPFSTPDDAGIAVADPSPADDDIPDPLPERDTDEILANDSTQLSLLRLASELECALAAPTASETAFYDEPQADTVAPTPALAVIKRQKIKPPPDNKGLEGCKVAAIGFGRQDIAGLASAMIDRRARIEFLPRGDMSQLSEFDLLLLNAASTETLKREVASFREILGLGIPTIVIGSRAALTQLRDTTDPFTWDFAPKPLHLEELAWRAVALLTRQQAAGTARRLPARVVVADGDPFTRTLIDSAMTQLGIDCKIAEEGESAWQAIEETRPGAVILDLTLSNRDGFQLIADIRRSAGRKPKIIVLSARQSEADILRAFSLGADDYITKPFSPLELSARLTRLLGGLPEHA